MSPAQSLVLAFIALILAGSGAMYLPFTTHEPISYVDALFTATASVTVVGLAVLDFEKDLTTAGQVVVLVLIQLGGLGIVTIASVLILTVRRRLSMGAEDIMGARFAVKPRSGLRGVVIAVAIFAFIIELIGAALLFAFWPEQESIGLRLWYSVFHAISAFCNAGITLFSNGLVGFESNWGVNLTVMALVVLGGFGFMNLQELTARAWNRR